MARSPKSLSVASEIDLDTVDIVPDKVLTFAGTFLKDVEQRVTITNPTTAIVAFKLKSTLPDLIIPHPGYGYLKSKESCNIQAVLKSMKYEHKVSAKKQHFTIELAIAPDVPPPNAYKFWKEWKPKDTVKKRLHLKFVKSKPQPEDDRSVPEKPDEGKDEKSTSIIR